MKKLDYIINLFLKVSIVFMMALVIFIDSDILNEVFVEKQEDLVVMATIKPTVVVSNKSLEVEKVEEEKVDVNNTYVAKLNVVNNDTSKWVWPTNSNYKITSYFGYRWGKLHGAIDINGPGYGSNIYAANKGVVVTVKGGCVSGNTSCNGSGGNYIIIKHNINNYYTIYMHLKDIRVRVGDNVGAGQIIGTMGNTGNVVPVPSSNNPYAGTHLHFGLYIGEPYRGGYAVDPLRLY